MKSEMTYFLRQLLQKTLNNLCDYNDYGEKTTIETDAFDLSVEKIPTYST